MRPSGRSAFPIPFLAAAVLAGCQATAPADRNAAPQASSDAEPTVVARATPGTTATKAIGKLDGADEGTLRRHFGTPTLSRRDGPALVLAYRFDDCVLHLFLYPRDDDTDPRVRHAAAIGTDRRTRDEATCRP